jgi:hypothetical protein
MLPAGSVQGQQQAANGMTEAGTPAVEDSVSCWMYGSQLQTVVGSIEWCSLDLVLGKSLARGLSFHSQLAEDQSGAS